MLSSFAQPQRSRHRAPGGAPAATPRRRRGESEVSRIWRNRRRPDPPGSPGPYTAQLTIEGTAMTKATYPRALVLLIPLGIVLALPDVAGAGSGSTLKLFASASAKGLYTGTGAPVDPNA